METLWLAIVLYSIGLGLVLHFRPALMFHENGSWKEFGYQRSPGRTLFPFWLFAVSWAFVSYALAATASWVYPTAGLATGLLLPNEIKAFEPVNGRTYEVKEEEEDEVEVEDEEEEEEQIAPKRGRGRPRKQTAKPGYYVLDPATTSGLRKYIYYGTSPPQD